MGRQRERNGRLRQGRPEVMSLGISFQIREETGLWRRGLPRNGEGAKEREHPRQGRHPKV